MSGQPEHPFYEPCWKCGDGDAVSPRGYWRCDVCDAEWNIDDEDEPEEDPS